MNEKSELKLVLQLQPLSELQTVVEATQDTDLNKQFAKKVAQNLFNYLQSFSQDEGLKSQGMMIVPTNVMGKWYERFLRKYDLDPNFVYKSTE